MYLRFSEIAYGHWNRMGERRGGGGVQTRARALRGRGVQGND